MAHNAVRQLNLSQRYIDARYVANAKELRIEGRAIVVNIVTSAVPMGETPQKTIPPLSSAFLQDTSIEQADSLVVLRFAEEREENPGEISGIVREPDWKLLADVLDGFPRDTQLWKGPQDEAGLVSFMPESLLAQCGPAGEERDFRVKVNLWFAPAGTDCRIHNIHEFVEVHTQVHGFGRMQKFRGPDHGTLYEDVLMSPGVTHTPFCVTGPGSTFEYPWHQYRADTDCVWLAVEYHEVRKEEGGKQA